MNIRERRKNRGWTQKELADATGISRTQISRYELGLAGPNPDDHRRLARAFDCSSYELKAPPSRKAGRQVVPERKLVERFRTITRFDPAGDSPAHGCLPAARKRYPELMRRLDALLLRNPQWDEHLGRAPSDSDLETVAMILEMERGARPILISPTSIGFERFPVTAGKSWRVVGHIPVPALVSEEWLWIHQVTVRTPAPFRVDGLVLYRPRGLFVDYEVDGRGHDPAWDEDRAEKLQLPTLRMNEREVLEGGGLTVALPKLQESPQYVAKAPP